ncbi:unnamed protein product, partial [Wuchereria bancrofti]
IFLDEEAAYASGVGGQQYYNDQYEGRQSKYGRDWGEPTRTTWRVEIGLMLKNVSDCLRNVLRKAKQVKDNWMDASLLPPTPADSAGDISDEPVRKSRRKEYSYALLLAYQGKKYNGMQLCIGLNQCMRPLFYELGVCDVNVQYWQYLVQKDFPTIEGELFKAMAKCGYICENDVFSPVRFAFQRAARTDRSVSAARQMCSMRLAPENHEYFLKTATDKLNAHLPEEIRVLGVRRAIRSFKAHKNCDKRTYSYTLPTYAFARANELTNSGFRMSETSMAELNDLLALYKGTHNFFNYTSGRRDRKTLRLAAWKNRGFMDQHTFLYYSLDMVVSLQGFEFGNSSFRTYEDRSSMRYIHDFKCGPTQLVEDEVRGGMVEFITLYITGQSFMLHQIRKMIGMTVATFRGLCGKTEVANTFLSERMDVPKAPGLGLVLDKVHYERYDKWHEKTHQALNNWGEEIETKADEFRQLYIISEIYRQELATQSMFLWLTTLIRHDITIPKITRESRERSPLGLASDHAYVSLFICFTEHANEKLKEIKEEKQDKILNGSERRDDVVELMKKDSDSQSRENSEGNCTNSTAVLSSCPKRMGSPDTSATSFL